MTSLEQWQTRAGDVLPAAGFGNFDPSVIIQRGAGARVWDEAGDEFVDWLIGSGPMVLGHGHPEVIEAIQEQLTRGMTFFANNAAGIELGEEICRAVPSAEQVRYVSSGGEADMYAMRLARAFTGRDRILKFEGGYHGMSAEALMSLSPQRLVNYPVAVPDSAGIPQSVADNMVISPFNDIEAVRSLMDQFDSEIAAVIVEPLQRIIPPQPGFLEALREECTKRDIVLIFDEVVTGFRFDYGGAQTYYGVTPDLCTLGKVIGGGFPLAATAGRADIMAHFDKAKVGADGFTFQVGTLSGNPVASVAGLKTMEIMRRENAVDQMIANGKRIITALETSLSEHGIDHEVIGHPTLFEVVFKKGPNRNYRDLMTADANRATAFNKALHNKGILKPPSKWYSSAALTEADLTQTEEAIRYAASVL